jgi:endonuclease YncB( thermonuclease family)
MRPPALLRAAPLVALLAAAVAVAQPAPGEPEGGKVIKVYDGDTLTLLSGDKVRLKWVNTPELRPAEAFGIEARDAAAKLVLNQEIRLLYGPGESHRDSYGRLVAGVMAGDTDLSIHLLERGLGHVFLIPPDDRDPAPLLAAQARAKAARLGVWATEGYQGALHITSFHANGKGDDTAFVNGEYLRITNIAEGPIDLSMYRLRNLDGKTFPLPAITVPAGHTVKVHSGKGTDQTQPDRQLEVYLGSETPLYDNKRDKVTILDLDGGVVDSRDHEVK